MIQEKVFVSAVVYLRNDESRVEDFLLTLDATLGECFENVELIVVDDNSSDATRECLAAVKDRLKSNVMAVNLAWRHGIEQAMFAGTDIAIGDFVYEIESADIFYPTDIFLAMYREATGKGIDVVSATGTRSSSLSSRLFYSLLNRLSYLKLELETEDVRLVTRRVLNRVMESENKVRYRKILYKYSGFKSGTIRFDETKQRGPSRNTLGEKTGIGFDILLMFTNIGTQTGLFFSLLFTLVSVGLGIYTLFVFFVRTNIASGWPTLMLFLSFGFSGMFMVLAIISKYLGIILTEIQGSRSYTVKSLERLVRD